MQNEGSASYVQFLQYDRGLGNIAHSKSLFYQLSLDVSPSFFLPPIKEGGYGIGRLGTTTLLQNWKSHCIFQYTQVFAAYKAIKPHIQDTEKARSKETEGLKAASGLGKAKSAKVVGWGTRGQD